MVVVLLGAATLTAVGTAQSAHAVGNAPETQARANNTVFAYVAVGESVSTAGNIGDVTEPDGTTHSGPGTYGPADTAGVWTISLPSLGANVGYDWDVTVTDSAGATVSGRVWADSYNIIQGGGALADLQYWVVNDTGYIYNVQLNGYNGINSVIQANSVGWPGDDCAPTYASYEYDPNGVGSGFPTLPDCGETYRVFLEEPSADLPATATSAGGPLNVLPPVLEASDLAVTDLAFQPDSVGSSAGTFTYSINPQFQGSYQLQIDVDGDGDYTGAQDVAVRLGADGSGQYSYQFDGNDATGQAIADCTQMHARIYFDKLGEIHVLQSDVEGRAGGISISRLNGAGAPDPTIYWDDTDMPSQRSTQTPQLDGTAGVDSTGGVHGWAYSVAGWGNGRIIDDWAYLPADLGTGEIAIGGQCLKITKTADTDEVVPGDTITYTIAVQNTGDLDYTTDEPASFSDDLSAVLDDAAYNDDATGGAAYAAPVLSWSGALAAGATQTFTYSVTVNDPDSGDQRLTNAVVSETPGANCPAGSTDPDCRVVIPAGSYTVAKAASTALTLPGGIVGYTVTVTNTGDVDYTADKPASFVDDLSAVLDDATYNDDATAGAAVSGNQLSWSGPLTAGASQTIQYSVTVDNPDNGDMNLTNAVVPTGPGGSCVTTGDCTATTLVQSYTVAKTSDAAGTVHAGDTITYTVEVANTGAADYTSDAPVAFADDLSAVLDDATYNDDASGGATVTGDTLSWAGPLAAGASTTITYSVTVGAAGTGDGTLTNAVTPTGPGGQCATDDGCTTTTALQAYTVAKSASTAKVNPGDTVTYTVTVTNTGAVAYTADQPASFSDDLSAVLDDATYNDDATGGATVTGDALAWSGALAVGATQTITYSVTVNSPDNGDHSLDNAVTPDGPGGLCDPAAECGTTTLVQSYTATKTADTDEVVPGEVITYTITLTNTGKVAYTDTDPATFTDDLTGVLDDATYNNDATGGAAYAAPSLSWAGALAVGETQTITYTVTVNDPDTGDSLLPNAVVTGVGGNCAVDSNDPACLVLIPSGSYTVTKAASDTTVDQGGTLTYTVTVTNTGAVDYTADEPASFSDDLSAVLDDATYNDDASGGATVTGTTLTWSGALAIGATKRITYSVTANNPDAGDLVLNNFVRPTSPGGACASADECATSTPVRALEVSKTVDSTNTAPGKTLTYTITVTNTGAADYTADAPASFTDDLSDVLDDATYNNDATNGAGYDAPSLSWSAPLAIDATATITYSVTVKKPDTGDHVLTNAVVAPGSNCAADSDDADCTVTTKVTDPTPPGLAATGTPAWMTTLGLGGLMTVLAGLIIAFFRRRKTAE
jgi:uncharacterized repeat protein (TIGR01451 family)